jgi:predicted GNAT superfamily acetyltransferase
VGDIRIRDLETLSEHEQCVDLQKEIWSLPDRDLVPAVELLVVCRCGGLCIGAFDGEVMVGLVCGMVAREEGRLFHHSHMVGVVAGYRGRRIGEGLKWAQRDRVLGQGLDFINWTFDPLQAPNANFNINRLGVVVRKYFVDLYGETTSALHGGLPTDRFEAEWAILGPRVVDAREGKVVGRRDWNDLPRANCCHLEDELPKCEDVELELDARELLIEIPPDITRIMSEDPELALSWRLETRRIFQSYMSRGYLVVGFHVQSSRMFYRMADGSALDEGSPLLLR